MTEDTSGASDVETEPGSGTAEEATAADSTEGGTASDPGATSVEGVGTDLVDRVATHDEALAAEVERLQDRIVELDNLLAERDDRVADLESKLKRTQADFQNYKKRAKRRQEEIRDRATEEFVERVVGVRDNLVRALKQEEGADIRGGVEATLDEFDRVLEEENVEPIEPDPGTETDPLRHQVMTTVDSDLPEGTVVDVYRPGYEMAGSVIREAQVTVSTGTSAPEIDGDPANGEATGAANGDE
jgi:molecular chaperone GrpE